MSSSPASKLRRRDDVRFVEEEHRYFVSDLEYLSLTRMLRASGLIEMNVGQIGTLAMERGTICHSIFEFDDLGILDEETVDPSLHGYLRAWRKFRENREFVLLKEWVEGMGADDDHRIACRLDRVFMFRRSVAVVDIKTGMKQGWHDIQTAGQARCLGYSGKIRRFIVYVQKDGKYKVDEHTGQIDDTVYSCAANVAWWKFNTKGGLE